jgi:hypothetical protein
MTEEGIKKALKEANEFIRRAKSVLYDPNGVVILSLLLAAVFGIAFIAAARALTTPKPAIVHDGPLVITQAEVIEQDKYGMCKYTIAQDDGGEEFETKFHLVARCDKHHVWDRLALAGGGK